jgi:hypothetical protein
MRVMVFFKSGEIEGNDLTVATPEKLAAFEAMDEFTEELVKAGVFIAGAGLKAGTDARRVAFEGASRTVIDGPFAETREMVAGFSIWEVKDMDEAMAWVKRSPNPNPGQGRSEIEIRPFYEAEDLGAFATPEDIATARTGDRGKLGVA